MKNALLVALGLSIAFALGFAVKIPSLDKSPHDISYHKEKMKPKIKVLYGRPYKKGREIFGNLVKYDKVWRTGANETTEIKFYQDVQISDTKVSAGTYSLYTIPNADKWTVIFNSNLDTWGHYQYKSKGDVARADATVSLLDEPIENFTITFDKTSTGANMIMAWDKTQASLPISFE